MVLANVGLELDIYTVHAGPHRDDMTVFGDHGDLSDAESGSGGVWLAILGSPLHQGNMRALVTPLTLLEHTRLGKVRDLSSTTARSAPQPSDKVSNCSGSSWRSGAQAPYRSRLGWSAGAFRHVLSSHTGSSLLYLVWELRSHPFYLIKSLCNCTSAAPMSSVPSVKRSTQSESLSVMFRSPASQAPKWFNNQARLRRGGEGILAVNSSTTHHTHTWESSKLAWGSHTLSRRLLARLTNTTSAICIHPALF